MSGGCPLVPPPAACIHLHVRAGARGSRGRRSRPRRTGVAGAASAPRCGPPAPHVHQSPTLPRSSSRPRMVSPRGAASGPVRLGSCEGQPGRGGRVAGAGRTCVLPPPARACDRTCAIPPRPRPARSPRTCAPLRPPRRIPFDLHACLHSLICAGQCFSRAQNPEIFSAAYRAHKVLEQI